MRRGFILKDRQLVARDTSELVLATADSRPFAFTAGQNVEVIISEPLYRDESGNRRTFSIAKAPGFNEIHLAFRHSGSAWKRSALTMPLGSKFEIKGPSGVFTLPDDTTQSLTFIAGGIGITPFRSMIQSLGASKPPITLFYANRDEATAAYLDELRAARDKKIINLVEHYGPLASNLQLPTANLYYIAGPITMTNIAMEALGRAGVPRGAILIEQFTGYE